MTFNEWFYSASHRAKYTKDHPAYLAAQEAWEAAHEACAKLLNENANYCNVPLRLILESNADAIRARGQQ